MRDRGPKQCSARTLRLVTESQLASLTYRAVQDFCGDTTGKCKVEKQTAETVVHVYIHALPTHVYMHCLHMSTCTAYKLSL